MSILVASAGGFFLGLLVFLLLPFVGAGAGWRAPARFMFLLATMPISRLAIVVSENNDILTKPMEYDALGVERIKLDGEKKAFEDPANRLHSWLGLRFALADEETGTLFDPRDAALGQQKREYDERGEASFLATNDEWDARGIEQWVPGAFALPDAHQLVDLSAAAELVDGGERSEYPKRVKELYKHSRNPFSDGVPMLRMFLPVIAFMATFGGIWMLASQLGTPGGSGGGGSIVSFGGATLAAIGSTRRVRVRASSLFGSDDSDDSEGVGAPDEDPLADPSGDPPERDPPTDGPGGGSDGDDGRDTALIVAKLLGIIAAVVLPVAVVAGIFIFAGPIYAIFGTLTFIAGLLCLPVLAQLGRLSAGVADAFAGLFFKLGFASYSQPVLVWTPEQYELRDYNEMDTAASPTWYTLFGTRIGFSFEPGTDAFGQAGVSSSELDSYTAGVAADGGETSSNVPSARYDKAPELGPDGAGGFVPARRSGYGVLTDIALGWWSNSADGTKSMRELLAAKEEFGGDEPPVSDKTIAYLTAAMGGVGAILGVLIFLV